jgi:8-oxo-dGTP pyrophosphatase MutT (NUDIX family)
LSELRRAAVIVPILSAPPPMLVFVRRAAHLRRHAGQIAFPGGLVEEDDAGDLARTALRELDEELGIPSERIAILGRLPDVETVTGGVRITPFVGLVAGGGTLSIDPAETEEVFEVPLDAVFVPGAVHEGDERVGTTVKRTWQFDHGSIHVWGATGRILRDFVAASELRDTSLGRRLAQLLPPRPGAVAPDSAQ